jgi:hypothetical protein
MAAEAFLAGSAPAAASRRFKFIGIGLLLTYALIAMTGDGEFWPFSKFPMFSRAGRPWTRALAVELAAPVSEQALGEVWEKELPGRPFALHHYQINQDDLSAVMRSYTPPLTDEQTDFLAKYFERVRHDRTLVLYSVRGRFRQDRSVRERFTPVAIIASSRFNPLATLFRKYFDGFCIDSPTRALAAKCMTASGWNFASAASI